MTKRKMSSDRKRQRGYRPILRRADQAAVAGLVLLALVLTAAYWIVQGGAQGRLIDVERAPRRQAEFLVDINTAEWPELAQLPGIGETLARRIVESRETEGLFLDEKDLVRVRGIGPRTLERLRPHLVPIPSDAELAVE